MRKIHPQHGQIQPLRDFRWTIVNDHRDPLTRLTEEAVLIEKSLSGASKLKSLNRKGEYFAAKERWESR